VGFLHFAGLNLAVIFIQLADQDGVLGLTEKKEALELR
jgi:hypothetical protein